MIISIKYIRSRNTGRTVMKHRVTVKKRTGTAGNKNKAQGDTQGTR
jgi:hypothetical protein